MEKLQNNFVLYRLPKENKIYLIQDQTPNEIDNISDLQYKAFIIAPFDNNSKSPIWAFDFKYAKEITENEILNLKIETPKKSLKEIPVIINKEQHKEAVEKMIAIIKEGELGKGVLSRIKTINRNKESLSSLFIELSKAYPNALVYLVYLPND